MVNRLDQTYTAQVGSASFAPATPPPTPSVLFVLNALAIGGSESKTVRLANALADQGSDVTIAYLSSPDLLLSEISPAVRVIYLQRRGKFSLKSLRLLGQAIRDRDSPVVVSVNLYPALYAAFARIWLGRNRFRLVMSVNTTEFPRGLQPSMSIYRQVLGRADVVMFGAETQRRIWRDRYGIGRSGRPVTAVLYNGVDTTRFSLEPTPTAIQVDVPNTRFIVGTVGRMRPEKSQVDLVRAIAALRVRGLDVGALIVGDGPEKARIVAEIDKLKMQDYVRLAGEARDVRPYLARMNVFALTSTGIETFSNAALEAMASGLPVVCSRVGGMEELISQGGGVSYAAGDVGQLTGVLYGILSDEVRRTQLAQNARIAAVEHFGWDRMVARFISLAAVPPRKVPRR
jgi:glycosyltransferase involved in cell wall biosynthesis